MSNPTQPIQGQTSPLDLPKPSLALMFGRALLRGTIGGLVCSPVIVAFVGVIALITGNTVTLFGLAHLGGVAALITSIFFFFFGLLAQSRRLQNRVFTITGFAATFFGLAMLVVFFRGLLTDVAHWLYYQPLLIEQTNWVTQKNRRELEDAKFVYDRKRAEVKRELDETLATIDKDDEKGRRELLNLYLGEGGKLDENDRLVQPEVDKLRNEAAEARKKAKTEQEKRDVRDRYGVLVRNAGGAWANALWNEEENLEEKRDVASRALRSTSVPAALTHFLWETPDPAPEAVGIRPALFGSLWLAFIMILFAVPIGVGAALYLEEYRSVGRLAKLIQININNLAGVPSIVFGILGAYVFVELIFKPIHLLNGDISVRNVIGGGLTLALLTLPVVIVATQEAIRAVPNSIRQGAYALGATQWQVIRTQVLPMARPGILTGTILAVSRAIGEAAPLVLFGATTFVAYNPSPISDFTVLPIQIYNWAERSTNPTIDYVAAATADNGVHVFEAISGRTTGRLYGLDDTATSVAYSQDGQHLVTGGSDHAVRIWSAKSLSQVGLLQKHDAPVTCVSLFYATARQRTLSGDTSGVVILWKRDPDVSVLPKATDQTADDAKREIESSVALMGHDGKITTVALSIDGKKAITGGVDGVARLWNTDTGKLITAFSKHTGPITAVRFGPRGQIWSASTDGSIRGWDESGNESTVLKGGHQGAVNSIAIIETFQYKRLISGGADGKVLSWNLSDGKVSLSLPEHAGEVTCVDAVNRNVNGNEFVTVVSGGMDQTIKYSELFTGKEIQTMRGRYGAVLSLSLDPAGRTINAWHNNMALASLVLLAILLLLNAAAIVLRNRAQQRVRV